MEASEEQMVKLYFSIRDTGLATPTCWGGIQVHYGHHLVCFPVCVFTLTGIALLHGVNITVGVVMQLELHLHVHELCYILQRCSEVLLKI